MRMSSRHSSWLQKHMKKKIHCNASASPILRYNILHLISHFISFGRATHVCFFKSGRCRQAFPWVETGLWVMGCDRRGHWTYLRWGVIVSSQSPSSQWWHQLGHELGFLMVHNWTAAIIQPTQLNGSVEKTYPEKCTLGQTRPTISDQNKERRSHLVQPQWPLLRI